MKKKLVFIIAILYIASVAIGETGVGKEFRENIFSKLTYNKSDKEQAENEESGIVEDESTSADMTDYSVYAAMENENANVKTTQQTDADQLAAVSESIMESANEKDEALDTNINMDFDALVKNFYQVDKTTYIGEDELNTDKLLGESMAINIDTDGPQILIYHTHSQETYCDSVSTDENETVVGLGNYLEKLLSEKYGYRVLHHKGQYDVGDRDHAYSNSLPEITQIINDNPSIQVVIDLHRDGVAETTKLATTIDGKPTAQIMFFNGLCRTQARGAIESLPNKYLDQNLAFSFQMQLAANQYYPGLTRRIYLKGYRYNMHLCPKSLLVEVGAQTNTKEEAHNAMEPLADILNKVLKKDK